MYNSIHQQSRLIPEMGATLAPLTATLRESALESNAMSRSKRPHVNKEPTFTEKFVASLGYASRKKARTKNTSISRNREGYVYLLHAVHDPTLYKIGRASNPDNRLRTFNVKLPFPVEYICTIKTDNMYQLEHELHQRFATQRLEGEFFRLSPADVQYIKELST